MAWMMEQTLHMQYSPGDAAVLSGDAKAYEYVPGGRAFVDDIEDFKTEYAHASPQIKSDFLQTHADVVTSMMARAKRARA